MDPIIYHPRKDFDKYKIILHNHAEEFFDNLVKEAKVDEGANKIHVNQYNTQKRVEEIAFKKLNGSKTGLGFAIFGIVMLFIVAFALIIAPLFNVEKLWWLFILSGVSLVSAITLLVFTIIKISKKVKANQEIYLSEKKKSEELLKVCYKDLENLNNSYDYMIPTHLMDDVIDILKMDEYLDNVRLTDLVENYKFEAVPDINGTTINALSGEMLNNPFVLLDSLSRSMAPKTYTGSIVVTVRVKRRDSKGNYYTSYESETLFASVSHPAPYYYRNTSLYYANDAAPNLMFYRKSTGAHKLDAKGQEKYVKSHIKEILKQSENALKKGKSNFTPTGNDAFDVFFAANDRSNEIEFRLLYTALAQQNTLDILTNKEPFGDDFSFRKNKKINIITSDHSQAFDYFWDLDNYRDYDIKHAKDKFIDFVDEYFKNLYFDFAPLLSIPLYQMHKGHPKTESMYKYNYSMMEHEIFANKLNIKNFRVSGASPTEKTILSYKRAKPVGKFDVVTLNASSYKTYPEVDMVPRTARDGTVHLVPVHWTRYEEVNEDKYFALYHNDINKVKFTSKLDKLPNDLPLNEIHYERGFIAFPIEKDINPSLSDKLDRLFKE